MQEGQIYCQPCPPSLFIFYGQFLFNPSIWVGAYSGQFSKLSSGRAIKTWRGPTGPRVTSWMAKSTALLSLTSSESPSWLIRYLPTGLKFLFYFFMSFPAEVSNPLSLCGTPCTRALVKAYQLSVCMVIVLPYPSDVLESNLKFILLYWASPS